MSEFTEKQKKTIVRICGEDFDWENLSEQDEDEIYEAASDELAMHGYKGYGDDIDTNEIGDICFDCVKRRS